MEYPISLTDIVSIDLGLKEASTKHEYAVFIPDKPNNVINGEHLKCEKCGLFKHKGHYYDIGKKFFTCQFCHRDLKRYTNQDIRNANNQIKCIKFMASNAHGEYLMNYLKLIGKLETELRDNIEFIEEHEKLLLEK